MFQHFQFKAFFRIQKIMRVVAFHFTVSTSTIQVSSIPSTPSPLLHPMYITTLPSSFRTHKKSRTHDCIFSGYFTSQQWHSFQLLKGMVLVEGLPSIQVPDPPTKTDLKASAGNGENEWTNHQVRIRNEQRVGRPPRCGFLCCDANKFLSYSRSWQPALCSNSQMDHNHARACLCMCVIVGISSEIVS